MFILTLFTFLIVNIIINLGQASFDKSLFYGLKLFYDSTNGPNWKFTKGNKWNFTDDNNNPCIQQWTGIGCNTTNSTVEQLILASYQLNGILPSDVFLNFSKIIDIDLSDNTLMSSVPNSLYGCSNLRVLRIANNQFTGLIPPDISKLSSSLLALNIKKNKFSGDINFLSNLVNLRALSIDNNNFYGSINPVTNLFNLTLIEMGFNQFSSRIPSEIGNFKDLVYLDLAHNFFTGEIPSKLSKLFNLKFLRLENNELTGEITNLFDISQQNLTLFDVSFNYISGYLPSTLFRLPKLSIVSLMNNQFHGSIPEDVCLAKNLTVLSLDGLTSSEKSDFLSIPRYMDGSIPQCLFNLPELQVLNVVGNALHGHIPEISPSSKLQNLSISHNRLNGTIPYSMQARNFMKLDLSYNKFNGFWTGPENISSSASIYLNQNRFSGDLSKSFDQYSNAHVLSGNIWICDYYKLPTNDPNHRDYDCTAGLYRTSMIAWGSFALFGFVASLIYFWAGTRDRQPLDPNRKSNPTNIKEYISLAYDYTVHFKEFASKASIKFSDWAAAVEFCTSNIKQVTGYLTCMRYLIKSSMIITGLLIVFALPLYPSLKSIGYGTHTKQISWETSGAFLSGVEPGGIFYMIWTIAVSVLLWRLLRGHKKIGVMLGFIKEDKKLISSKVASDVKWKTVIICISIILVSFTIVILVNILYVMAKNNQDERGETFAIMFFITLFNGAWVTMIVPFIIVYLRNKIFLGKTYWMRLKILLLLFNTIVAPILASAFTDNSCFRPLIEPYLPNELSYSQSECIEAIEGQPCIKVSIEETYYFQPPFIYNNLCSSILFSYYIPIYMYAYIVFGFFLPMGYVLFATTKSEKLPSWLFYILPGILWPRDENPEKFPFLFDPEDISASQLQHFTVLLTFGIASPILAVAISFAMCMEMYTWQVMLGRYIIQSKQVSDKLVAEGKPPIVEKAHEKINISCNGAWRRPLSCSWLVFWISAFFYMFITMDIATDTTTVDTAIWLPILIGFTPIMLWLYKKYESKVMKAKYISSLGVAVKKAGRRLSQSIRRGSQNNLEGTIAEMNKNQEPVASPLPHHHSGAESKDTNITSTFDKI